MAFDPDKARRTLGQNAYGNTVGTAEIAPQAAVEALEKEPETGIPAASAMYTPEVKDTAPFQRNRTIPLTDPHIAQWAQDPARAAATSDDYGNLAEIAKHIKAIPVVGDFATPALNSAEGFVRDTRRFLEANTYENRDTSPLAIIPGFSKADKALGSAVMHAVGLHPSVAAFMGGANALYVQPGSRLLSNVPTVDETGRRLTKEEAKAKAEETLNLSLFAIRPKVAKVGAKAAAEPDAPFVPREPTPPTGGRFGVDEHGFMMGEGGPASFADAKAAAIWRLRNASEGVQVFEHDLHPVTKEVGLKQVAEARPFSDQPGPGVDPVVDEAYTIHAKESADHLKDLEQMVVKSETFKRSPTLARQFVEQVAGEQVVKLDPYQVHQLINTNDELFSWVVAPENKAFLDKLGDASVSGASIEMPLAEYVAAFADKPWADELRKSVAVGDGISEEAAKELKPEEPDNAEVTYTPLEQEVSLDLETGELAAESPEYDEDLAYLKDMGLDVSGDYWSTQTGKNYPEPEDLSWDQLDNEQIGELKAAQATVKAAAKRVVKEQFLGQLFKDAAAAGMSETQYRLYSEKVQRAFMESAVQLWNKTFNNVKTQYSRQWKEAYDHHFPQVMNEVMATPVMKVEHALRYSAKLETDELMKDNAFVENGEPITFYHGSTHSTTGTPQNPWAAKGYKVISFSYDPDFASRWIGGSVSDALSGEYDFTWDQAKAPTVYVVHLKAKNPANFKNPEHVERAARWFAEKANSHLAEDYGINSDGANAKELLVREVMAAYTAQLKTGDWHLWERPDMWEGAGFDAAHMVESEGSPSLNVCIADGNQIFFKYVQRFEQLNMKLSQEVKKLYPTKLWEKLPKTMFSADGLSADEIAQQFEFPSGEEMLRVLSATERSRGETPFRKFVVDTIKGETRARTIADVGDILNPDRIYADASAQFASPTITDLLTTELQTLADKVGLALDKPAIEAFAQELFGRTIVKSARRIREYELTMGRTGRKAEVALLKGKYMEALKAKEQQLINHYQLIESHNLNRNYDRLMRKIKVWSSARAVKNMSQEYLDRIHAILLYHDVPIKRNFEELQRGMTDASGKVTSLSEWIESKRAAGEDITFEVLPSDSPDRMLVDDFRQLDAMLTSIAKNARKAKQIIDDGKARDSEAVVEEAVAAAGGLPNKPMDKNLGDWEPWQQGLKRKGIRLHAEQRILESLFDHLDGSVSGVFNRVLQRGADDAANKLDELQHKYYSSLIDAFEHTIPKETKALYSTKLATEIFQDPRGGAPITVRRGDLLAVLANMGTRSNRQKLAEGYNTTEEALVALLNQHITKEEGDFIQKVWDTFEELFPIADKNTRAMRGYGLNKIKALPLELAVGTFKGGYYPIQYDPKFNIKPIGVENPDDPMKAPFKVVTTPTGFEKERTNYKGPVLLSLDGVLRRHLRDVFVRVAYGEYVQSARRFILDQRIRRLWENKLGKEYYDLLMPWLEYQVFDVGMPRDDAKGVQWLARKLRQNLTTTVMGLSYSVGISQALGLIPAASELGLLQTLHGMKKFYMHAAQGNLQKAIYSKSEEMKYRHWNLEQNVRDVHEEISRLDITKTPAQQLYRAWRDKSMQYINFMDKWTVSGSVWVAAYEKALGKMAMSEGDAVRFADKMVRKTQGTGRPKDLPAVQRPNNELQRIFVFAATWPLRYYNLQTEAINLLNAGKTKSALRKLIYLMLIIPVTTALWTGDWPEDREDPEEWLWWTLRKITFGPASSSIWTRDLAGAIDRKASGKYVVSPAAPPMTRLIESTLALSRDSNQIKNWLMFLGLAGVIPGGAGQIGKTTQFASDVATGEQEPEDFGDWFEGFTKGKISEE